MAKISDVAFTDKWIDVIKDESDIIFLEGVTRSGKSLLATIKMYFDIMTMPKNKNKALLIGQSTTKLESDFVNHPFGMGLIDLFPNVEYKKHGTGGSRLEITTRTGLKTVELVGYSDKSSYKKIRGKGFSYVILDEGNLADVDFLSELWTGIAGNNARVLVTSNGDDPDLSFYQDYMNKCRPTKKYEKDVPDSTMTYMNAKEHEEGYVYYFFGHQDNPLNTPEKIRKLHNSVPKGTHRYITKILGERGVASGLVFRDYMSPNMIITEEEFNKFRIPDMYVGIDHGVKDLTVFVLTAITHNNEVIVVDTYETNMKSDEELYICFKEWFSPLYEKYMGKLRALFVDSAAQHLKLYFNKKSRLDFNLPAEDAWKFGDHDIKNRVDLNQQLMLQNKLFFLNKSEPIYKALGKIKFSEKANEIIDRLTDHDSVDRWDAFNYSISKHRIPLSRQ